MGRAKDIGFIQGRLNIGVAMSPPLIRAVKSEVPAEGVSIIDAPPGAACPVIAAIRGTDYVVLVTEPTPFGFHDLIIAFDTIKVMGIPFGVLVNRCDVGDGRVIDYCGKNKIPVLSEIPDDRRIAEAYSRGQVILDAVPDYRPLFRTLAERVHEELKLARNHRRRAC
jgi:MinD superfamily P-loop ATPase